MKRHRKSQPTLPLREFDADAKDLSGFFNHNSCFLAAFGSALVIFLSYFHSALKPASSPIQASGTITNVPSVPIPRELPEPNPTLKPELKSLQLKVAPPHADPLHSQASDQKLPLSNLNPDPIASPPETAMEIPKASPFEPAKKAAMALPPDSAFEIDHDLLAKIARGGGTQADRERLSIKMSANDLEARKRAGKEGARAAASSSQELPQLEKPAHQDTSNSFVDREVATKRFERATPREPQRPSVISDHCSVTASTMGNLGPPSVVTSESITDPLKDRWQAASDMNGTPIPGPQWLEIDLKQTCIAEKFIIDWETAYANDYVVQGWAKAVGRHGVDGWVTLADSKLPRAHLMSESSDGHVLHTLPALTLPKGPKWLGGRRPSVSKVKLLIRSPATQYGSSVWQMQVWGTCGGSNDFAAR